MSLEAHGTEYSRSHDDYRESVRDERFVFVEGSTKDGVGHAEGEGRRMSYRVIYAVYMTLWQGC